MPKEDIMIYFEFFSYLYYLTKKQPQRTRGYRIWLGLDIQLKDKNKKNCLLFNSLGPLFVFTTILKARIFV